MTAMLVTVAALVATVWVVLSTITGVAALRYFSTREPAGWHYNDTQAHAFPWARLSFYWNGAKRVVILKPYVLCPLLWEVHMAESYSRDDLELQMREPVWMLLSYAHTYMENTTALAIMGEVESEQQDVEGSR